MRFGIRELVFVVALLGLLAASYFLVFKKAEAERAALKAKIQTKEAALAELERATAGVADIERKVGELQQAIAFFESKLPQQREIDKILEELWQMAEANSLQTKTIKTLKSKRGAGFSEQPVDISLSGDFDGFYAFLLQLEKLPRLTKVTRMDLKKISGRDGEMEAQITLNIFFEPEGGVSPPKAAGAATASAAH